MLKSVVPILLVRDVTATAGYFRDRLGFEIDFLYGQPPFYGAVSRDGVCLHLRHVDDPPFAKAAAKEVSLICATVETDEVQALHDDLARRDAEIVQPVTRQAWGGTDFQVRDPDGNVVSFVTYQA